MDWPVRDSPVNGAAAEKAWEEHPEPSHLRGITIFTCSESIPADRTLLGQLDTIDLHHGVYSADPPYSELQVVGVSLTAAIRSALEALGFTDFHNIEAGFLATQPSKNDLPL
jgi:hypothetical protein